MQHSVSRLIGRTLTVVLFALVQGIVEIASDCPSSYYPPTHTACLNPSSNSVNPKGVSLADQATIVDEHNNYRSSVDATDMQKMYWDPELAFVAQKLAEQCKIEHDKQNNILCKYYAGQNIAGGQTSWAGVIKSWCNEKDQFTYGSSENDFNKVGHYTQVMWNSSAKVGCGVSFCTNYNAPVYVCNYAPPGNDPSQVDTPYTAGAKCSACPNSCKNGLCDCGGLVCKNDGVLNIDTCTCTCRSPYQGSADCNLKCDGVTDEPYCNKPQPEGYPVEFCAKYGNVPLLCPNMCGLCPVSPCLELQSIVIGDQATSSDVAPPTNTTARKPCHLFRRRK